eukprot:TRINITY_DN15145_c0_g1_i2.p1 TRINITY_DN15145_c0_g1~~TRINITY_DN15145_c0_g1_i2.p1  ORF type:complete len:182 (+),score=34.47 TRINITY_DN15145_c0_g1_i2:31-546(+)
MGSEATKFYNEFNNVREIIENFQNNTCPEMEKEGIKDCKVFIRDSYPFVSFALFNDKDGWFKADTWCDPFDCERNVKPADDTKVNCFDCLERMNAQAAFFDDGVIVGKLIYAFQYDGFCENSVKNNDKVTVDDCRKWTATYVARMMRSLKEWPSLDAKHRTFCKEYVKCVL